MKAWQKLQTIPYYTKTWWHWAEKIANLTAAWPHKPNKTFNQFRFFIFLKMSVIKSYRTTRWIHIFDYGTSKEVSFQTSPLFFLFTSFFLQHPKWVGMYILAHSTCALPALLRSLRHIIIIKIMRPDNNKNDTWSRKGTDNFMRSVHNSYFQHQRGAGLRLGSSIGFHHLPDTFLKTDHTNDIMYWFKYSNK